MQLDRFKIGNVGDGNLQEVAREIVDSGGRPALARTDGDIYLFDRLEDWWDVPVSNRDLAFVGRHAEVLPFVAMAFKEGLFDPQDKSNSILHIDAHLDDEYANETLYPFGQFALGSEIDFPRGRDEFQAIVDSCRNEITTFIAAMNWVMPKIALYWRDEFKRDPQGMPLYATKHYVNERCGKWLDGSLELRTILEATRFQLFSVDGDFCGAVREYFEGRYDSAGQSGVPIACKDKIIAQFERLMPLLMEGLKPEIERVRNDIQAIRTDEQGKQVPNTLYSVSYDPHWVTMPEEFVYRFLDEFYKQIVEAYAA